MIYMCSVNIAGQSKVRSSWGRECWKIVIGWQGGIWGTFVVEDSPMLGAAEVQRNLFQTKEVAVAWYCGKFAQSNHGVTDVWAACNVGIE